MWSTRESRRSGGMGGGEGGGEEEDNDDVDDDIRFLSGLVWVDHVCFVCWVCFVWGYGDPHNCIHIHTYMATMLDKEFCIRAT